MTEQKTKRRGWVKNAAIIFLAVLLILTFLSNTIMNHSLPEVAAQYVSSGTVTTRVRGTGSVTAIENYEVKITQSRKIQSVAVRVGDEVSVGDTLIYLSADSSEELKTAQDTLDDLQLAYEKALISAAGSDYAKENRDIQNARTALEEAEAARDALPVVTQEQVGSAKAALDSANAAVTAAEAQVMSAQAEVDTAQANLDALGGYDPGSSGGDYSAVTSAQNALTAAKNTLAAKEIQYGADYDAMEATANANRGTNSLAVYMQYLADVYSQYAPPAGEDTRTPEQKSQYEQYLAYTEITEAQAAVSAAQIAYDAAYNAYYAGVSDGNAAEWNRLNNILTQKKEVLAQMNSVKSEAEVTQFTAQSQYDDLTAKRDERKAAEDNVKTCTTSLEDLIFALQEQQKADGITSATTALDLEAQRKDIAEQQELIAQLQGDANGASVESQVAGTVASISVTAGDTAAPDTALMTIEVGDRGYTLSFSVTNEQARRVSVGDTAEVSNYYWGGDISATLTNIRNDPENPQTNKLLTFDVSGDIEAGTQLTLSVGQKSANYDMIVPNSALKSDTNGDFVLVVIAKSSPLGNRYVVQRADVQILASDDTNTAVSGALAAGDFVITTSTAPLEPGMQVRMAEG